MDDLSRQQAAPDDEMNRKAVLAVVLAFAAVFFPFAIRFLIAVIAIWLGWAARQELRDGGRGLSLAISGMILGCLGVLTCVIGLFS